MLAVLGAVVASGGAAAQQAPGAVYSGRPGNIQVRVPKLTTPPRIDGGLGDPAWQDAAVLAGFSQYQPVDRLPAADATEVLVFYTNDAIGRPGRCGRQGVAL